MEGLAIIVQFALYILDAFQLRTMFLASIGAIFFLTVFGLGWKILQGKG